MHQDDYKIQDDMKEPLAYLSSYEPDTMYFDQAMKQPEHKEFLIAEIREVNRHFQLKHWKLIPCKEVPKGQPVLESVWAINKKQDIVTRQFYKWKARLNVHRGQQEYGVNYLETYLPVVPWFSIITLLTLAAINKWHSRQVYFVQAYPQAPIKYDLYMESPKGFITIEGDVSTHTLKLIKNLYGNTYV